MVLVALEICLAERLQRAPTKISFRQNIEKRLKTTSFFFGQIPLVSLTFAQFVFSGTKQLKTKMPKDQSIKSVLIIGSGPIIIGQACEFDYSGSQAARSLR